jgi:hypothetical protein
VGGGEGLYQAHMSNITGPLQLDGHKCEWRHWGAIAIVFEVVGGWGRDEETL